MKALLCLMLLSFNATADISCYQTSSMTTCSNGMTAYQLGGMTQYNMPNGENVTIWNNNINRYQEVPVQPIPPIVPIMPFGSSPGVLQPFK
jgi:hypothetical protein